MNSTRVEKIFTLIEFKTAFTILQASSILSSHYSHSDGEVIEELMPFLDINCSAHGNYFHIP